MNFKYTVCIVSSPQAVERLQDGRKTEPLFSSLQLQAQTDDCWCHVGRKVRAFGALPVISLPSSIQRWGRRSAVCSRSWREERRGERRGEKRGEERRGEERREKREEKRREKREEERREGWGEKEGGRGRNSSKREREKEVRKDVKGGGRQSQTKRVEIHATVSMHTWTHSMGQNQACYSQGERGRGVGGGWASSPPPSPAHCGPKPVNPAQGTGRVQLDFSPAHKPYQKLHTTSLTHARVELVQYQKPAITVIN